MYKFTVFTIVTFLSICIFCTYFVNVSLLVIYPSLNLSLYSRTHFSLGTGEENGPVVQPIVQPWMSASATAHAIQHVDSHESRNGIQSDPWRTQTMRRNKREWPRKRDTISILGTGTADTIEIKVAPEPSRDIFVSRLHSDINSDKLKNYLESKNIVTRNVECISHPDSKSRSFKLSVPKSMFKTVFDATLWPEGISVKKYYSRYTNK